MNKKVFFLVLLTIILALLANVLFGRYLSAKISTLPVLNRLKLLSPQAPIVINNREVVRVNDSGELLDAANGVKTKISSVVAVSNNQATVVGSAINVTGEGIFMTTLEAVSETGVDYYIVLNDARTAKIESIVIDPATSLVFLKAPITNVPVASFDASASLMPGDKIVYISNALLPHSIHFNSGFITRSQLDVQKIVFDANRPTRSFGIDQMSGTGQVIIDATGEVSGLQSDQSVISADVIKNSLDLYIANASGIIRPSFGFSYKYITHVESQLLNLPEGVLVTSVEKTVKNSGPATTAGLLENDIITTVNKVQVTDQLSFEEILQSYKPGTIMPLTVKRGSEVIQVTLVVGQLK